MRPQESLDMSKQKKPSAEAAVRDIRRRTRRKFSPEEKIRIVLEGLRGEQSISELCRRGEILLGQQQADAKAEPPFRRRARMGGGVKGLDREVPMLTP
jgi:transposase-like protein